MLPSLLASEVEQSVRRYLQASFPMTTDGFRSAGGQTMLDHFLERPASLFKGPYLSLGLPFQKAGDDEALPFSLLTLPYRPYRHQMQAFARLCADVPRSTLVATGTGSGKTECFMLPLLDFCAGQKGQGVKAIIVYPMNALATDQARRFSSEIHDNAALRGKVSVGLFVGEQEAQPSKRMTAQSVITCKETLRSHPPDILLTNYKMLDYLLMRPKEQPLWQHNTPGILRYLVVDELHTFDGAQGTDLACLVRRLRDRLAPEGGLACVGTSATIGGPEAADELRAYASKVFASEFDTESVILEQRVSVADFLAGTRPQYMDWPTAHGTLKVMRRESHASEGDYLRAQALLWFGGDAPALDAKDPLESGEARIALAGCLLQCAAFQELLERASSLLELRYLLEAWQARFRIDAERARPMADSLLALVSAARVPSGGEDEQGLPKTQPLLQVRVQLWLRELRRMVSEVSATPVLHHADDLKGLDDPMHLPTVHCRACHATGWATLKRPDEGRLSTELREIYRAWFDQAPDVCVLFPLNGEPPAGAEGIAMVLCPEVGMVRSPKTGERMDAACEGKPGLRVWMPNMLKNVGRGEQQWVKSHHDCPWCGASEGLSLLGARAASLSSVLIGRLYGSLYNDHHKLIAFSDSVQDAAHRAGFFAARTYSTLVRAAIARFIHAQGEGFDLATVAREVPRYWRKQFADDGAFVGTFIASNMAWLRDYEHLQQQGSLPPGSDLPLLVERRLGWEVMQGFGLRARIGRTLERDRLAAVSLDTDLLQQLCGELATRLGEEIGSLRGVEPEPIRRFLLGVLWRMRVRGAFYHEALDEYIKSRGQTYMAFGRSLFMPNYGGASPPPALLSLGKVSSHFDNLQGNSGSWYRNWFLRTVASDAFVLATSEFAQVMALLVKYLERAGLLLQKQAGADPVWGLDPAKWSCTTQVAALVCGCCGHRIEVAAEEAGFWQGVPCLRLSCPGEYSLRHDLAAPTVPPARVPARLVCAEHTALLDADTRKRVEESFIHGDQAWDINLLSATPTLEMGIDIGDLSSVLLCSVPPSQANYLQRVGRAGRRDGNALALTVANGHNHDLYFYAEPREMIAGQVSPPGVFLQATAVLERQLTAFCFDRWCAAGVSEDALPARLQDVLNAIEANKLDRFPYTLFDFIQSQRASIMQDFLALFPELPAEAVSHLEQFLYGGEEQDGMAWRVNNRLYFAVEQRKIWTKRIDRLKAEREKLSAQPQDETTREQLDGVLAERGALMALRRSLNQRATLNFFTDEGLLPNYAFPEEGVNLQSVILRRRTHTQRDEDEGTSRYEKLNFSLQRPAQAALSELAPQNRFYAVGRQVEIDQVDLDLSPVEEWRLCNQCHHVENVTLNKDPHSVCPRCGSPQWIDAGQKRSLLKLRQVYATADDRDSRIADDSDQRTPVFFQRQMLVEVPPQQATKAYRLPNDSLPFAFEYLPRVIMREINFGQPKENGEKVQVAGELASRPGFQICRHCGKVRRTAGRVRPRFEHAYDCRLRRAGVEATDKDYFDSLYLFRELESEAVRILLPLADIASSEVALNSLIASINLGLKRYFKGNIDHLRVTHYSEPSEGNRRQYLVLYDSVPGGTGYLKELLSEPERLIGVLQAAYQVVSRCECQQDEHKDGCYRCLLAYRDSRNMETISRQVAEQLLARILAEANELEAIEGLNQVSINSLLESELEQRFIQVLGNAGPGVKLTQQLFDGKNCWVMTLGGSQLEQLGGQARSPMAWKIEPQVNLGPAHGIQHNNSRPDFVFWPMRDMPGLRPVAVFLDGFAHHYNKLDDDTAKRQAILDSGKYWVWSLGWHDLPMHSSHYSNPAAPRFDRMQQEAMVALFSKLAASAPWEPYQNYQKLIEEGPFNWLLRYLAGGVGAALRYGALSRALAWVDAQGSRDPLYRDRYRETLQHHAPGFIAQAMVATGEQASLLGGDIVESQAALPVFVALPVSAMQQASQGQLAAFDEIKVHIGIDDRFASADNEFSTLWQAFWGMSNLLQFLPGYSMSSVRGVEQGRYHPVEMNLEPEVVVDEVGSDWQELCELSVFGRELLELRTHQYAMPEVGYELREGDAVCAEAELAWPEERLAVFYEDDEETRRAFIDAGWQVFVGLDAYLRGMA